MYNRDKRVLHPLKRMVKGKSPSDIIDMLWRGGMLNRLAMEQQYIKDEVAHRVRNGESKMRAMEMVAYDIGCSFEKVRSVVYRKETKTK